VSSPGDARTLRVKFWLDETRGSDEVIVNDGGVPVTGTTSTLALLKTTLPILETVTEQVIREDMAGKLINLKDAGINDMSNPMQFQENDNVGCSLGRSWDHKKIPH